jgi:undecaprenyl-diphosphatase
VGTAAALLVVAPPRRPRPALLAAAVGPPALAGWRWQDRIEQRLGTPGTLAAGLLAGGAALVVADRAPSGRRAEDATVADGLVLGLAQCAALWPGVSRSGATLAAARARGFSRPEASRLSWEVGLPVMLGAACLSRPRPLACSAVAFGSTLAAAKTLGFERRGPLWRWAVWRAVLAGAILAVRHNRAR